MAGSVLYVPKGKREIDLATRERIAQHLRWWMALHDRNQSDVERLTGIHNSTVSRLLKLTQRSLGLDVFLRLNRKLPIDAERMLNGEPEWERLERARGKEVMLKARGRSH